MSQPLFNPLRNAMIGASGVSSLGPSMHNNRFPSSGIPFSAQNTPVAPKHVQNPNQNSTPGFGKGGGGNKPGSFYAGSQAFAPDTDQSAYHRFTAGATGSGTDGHYGSQHGYKKEYFDSQGQHHPVNQKGDLGPTSRGNPANSQWESSRMWQSPPQRYEARSDLYNPEEPTPDTKFSPANSPAFSRHNNGNASNCVTNLQPHELNDIHGIPPLHLPHTCSICDKKVFNLKDWELHIKGRMHIQKAMAVSENAGIHCVSSAPDGISPSSMNAEFNPLGKDGYGTEIDQLFAPAAPAAAFLQSGLSFAGPPSGVKFAQRKSSTGRVVHICNLPEGSNENDVINLGLPFGKITNYILMKATNQAFLEMAYTEAAEAMVQFYQEKPATINDEKLLIRMSKRYIELQLKKPGKNVDAIIHDIHSQRERDLFRGTDRYQNGRTRSRSPVSRSLSPRSHTPSFTSCSSTHSPLGASRTEWGNGRESWDQSSYGRWEDDREQGSWRDNREDKRDRTDHWVHDRKHYSRQLEKQDLDDRVDGLRGHRDKYSNSHSSSRYKSREGEYYRKEAKPKADGKPQDTLGKSKRKEEGKTREVKGNHKEEPSKKDTQEAKTNKECDGSGQKNTEKNPKGNSTEEETTESVEESKENEQAEAKEGERNSALSKEMKEAEEGNAESVRLKEEDWESESDVWYPTNMEELVTVDEVGEEDFILEPDITELEEIVSVEPKDNDNCVQMYPHGVGTLDLERRLSQSSGSECSSPREASIAMSCTSLRETASPDSSCCDPVASVLDVSLSAEQKFHDVEENRVPGRPSCVREEEGRAESAEGESKTTEPQNMDYRGEIGDNPDPCADIYQRTEPQADHNLKARNVQSQEERRDGREENLSISERKSVEVSEFGSKELHSSPSWEQDDIFTDLSIPLGVEFVVPRTGFYCKLCGLFYTSEETAKTSHCRSRVHYKNLQNYLSKLAEGSLGIGGVNAGSQQEDVGIVPQFEKNRP
ncbi:RNA-binding protein 20 isoform X2 [Spea bombifrons]|nr:RNA-binding protein 20 isoform X2 [Spea bombifrons]